MNRRRQIKQRNQKCQISYTITNRISCTICKCLFINYKASFLKYNYICSGKGFIHTLGKIQPLSEGDVFFTFPASPVCIESVENFSYMYISFLGSRANMIMEKLKISNNNFLFTECSEIYNFRKNGLDIDSELTDLISENILLYTFSFLGNRTLSFGNKNRRNDNTAAIIKKYIDDNFSDTDFSLDNISNELTYNKKYISTIFKKISVLELLNI